MKIVIETIPHGQQRYPTAGDWVFEATGLKIWVSDLATLTWKLLSVCTK